MGESFRRELIRLVELADDADLCEALQHRKGARYLAQTLKDGRRKVVLYLRRPKQERPRTMPEKTPSTRPRKRERAGKVNHGF